MFHHRLRNLKNACLKRNIRRKKVILQRIPLTQFLSNGMKRLPAYIWRSTGAQSWEGELQLYPIPSPLSFILVMSQSKAHLHIHEGVEGLEDGGGALSEPVRETAPAQILQDCPTRASALWDGETCHHEVVGAALSVTFGTEGSHCLGTWSTL